MKRGGRDTEQPGASGVGGMSLGAGSTGEATSEQRAAAAAAGGVDSRRVQPLPPQQSNGLTGSPSARQPQTRLRAQGLPDLEQARSRQAPLDAAQRSGVNGREGMPPLPSAQQSQQAQQQQQQELQVARQLSVELPLPPPGLSRDHQPQPLLLLQIRQMLQQELLPLQQQLDLLSEVRCAALHVLVHARHLGRSRSRPGAGTCQAPGSHISSRVPACTVAACAAALLSSPACRACRHAMQRNAMQRNATRCVSASARSDCLLCWAWRLPMGDSLAFPLAAMSHPFWQQCRHYAACLPVHLLGTPACVPTCLCAALPPSPPTRCRR